jgi:hypothetical protein
MHHVNGTICAICAGERDHERGCPRSATFGLVPVGADAVVVVASYRVKPVKRRRSRASVRVAA